MNKNFKNNIRYFQNIILSDRIVIQYKFKKYIGYFPSLKNPKTFNEKLQWLKLHEFSQQHTVSADKYLSRNYISKLIGEKHLIPLVFQTNKIEDIVPDKLPDYPFIIKTNHDSGGTIIVKNKLKIEWEKIHKFLDKRLKNNYYYFGRERQYKNIKPCIIVEKLLLDKNGNLPYDLKVYCFNGIAKIIVVDKDRGKSTQSRNWYSINWKKKDIHWGTVKGDNNLMTKPKSFNQMINLSEKIAQNFTFVRIDCYELDGKLFIGEITQHPGSGFVPFYPEKWDRVLGNLLKLPI